MENSTAMNSGDGPNSYTQNSKFQGDLSDRAKDLLSNSIQEKLKIKGKPRVFSIADLGCSVGPNTFSYVQTIVEAVKLNFKTHGLESQIPDFHVFFNDHVANDFNTLFKGLKAEDRQYFAAGVPGSFHGRLFPKASMNFMISCSALHWLNRVPEEVTKEDSPLWNKGNITYVNSSYEVAKAFSTQFFKGMKAFLDARSAEITEDGLLAILMPCRPQESLLSESFIMHVFECLGYALNDMAKEGLVTEALVDSFNIPIFLPTSAEVQEEASRNEYFSIEIMKEMYYPRKLSTPEDARFSSAHVRATVEGILSKHFGSEIIDELFERYTHKLEEFSKMQLFTRMEKFESLFLLVKRNGTSI